MSVVNDVLKNLNERHAQERSVQALPLVYDFQPKQNTMLYVLLALVLVLSVSLAVKFWWDGDRQYLAMQLPLDAYYLAPEKESPALHTRVITSSNGSSKSDNFTTPESNQKEAPAQYQRQKPSAQTHQNQSNQRTVIAEKTAQSKAVASAVAALKSGDTEQTQAQLPHTPKAMQDELKLRLMMKQAPAQVLPYIQKNFSDFSQTPDLLAMAAQGQQRSGQHESAMTMYKQLIHLQPKDARWRAGMAISLEASGDKINAQKMYRLALNMPGLPKALSQFSRSRLQSF